MSCTKGNYVPEMFGFFVINYNRCRRQVIWLQAEVVLPTCGSGEQSLEYAQHTDVTCWLSIGWEPVTGEPVTWPLLPLEMVMTPVVSFVPPLPLLRCIRIPPAFSSFGFTIEETGPCNPTVYLYNVSIVPLSEKRSTLERMTSSLSVCLCTSWFSISSWSSVWLWHG